MQLRILVAADEEAVRANLRTVLERRVDWQVCGEAADGKSAVCEASKRAPDVVIVDLSMPA